MQRNHAIDIAKGFAIITVVIAHAEMPGVLNRAIYLFHMPLFFIAAGYFFSKFTAEGPWEFVVKRFKGLYVPFVKWSVFFLLIHNWLFDSGVLNEQYGNWEGGVTHPYTFHQAAQRLVSIVFSMGGYDEFLCGAYWFFRGLLVASLAFMVLYVMLIKTRRLGNRPVAVAWAIALGALALGAFKVEEGLKITTLVQGGYRDIMGTMFFALGFIYRQWERRLGHSLWVALAGAGVVVGGAYLGWAGMTLKPQLRDVFTLALTGTAGWLMTYNVSYHLAHRAPSWTWRWLARCGELSLYIFIWHVAAYKVVSLLKIWWYGLDMGQIGCHMVIHEHAATDFFWVLYTVAGVGIPVGGWYMYRALKKRLAWPRIYNNRRC